MEIRNTADQIYFNFSYFALKLLGKGLYNNPWTAIAELVANGFDANATEVNILIDMRSNKNATVEIFDNGFGMGYDDLAEKYVLIGKNKRIDDEMDEYHKQEVMGRKGVGKLAALYLSNKFYLLSKTKSESTSWCLDLINANDSDLPRLNKANLSTTDILSNELWQKNSTGTMIKLTNVDLTNIGQQTLEGLKARLADFYLIDELNKNINICVLSKIGGKLEFQRVVKNIAYKNMYAFFNTPDFEHYQAYLSNKIYYHSDINEVDEIRRDIRVFNPQKFTISGEDDFLTEDGEKLKLPYFLTGWIGLHSSINKNYAQKNDPNYLKNKAYRPNQLRLYIRKKLAIQNFLDYLNNTQAFGNYIEGEISFDILDDNRLPDITTSNRQDVSQDDKRIGLLKDILNPIVGALIRSRIELATAVKQEEKRIHDAEEQKLLREKKLAEEAEKRAEEEKNKAISEKKKVEIENEQLKDENNSEKQRAFFYSELVSEDKKNIAKKYHLVKTNNNTIKNTIDNLVYLQTDGEVSNNEILNDLRIISFCSEKISAVLNYGAIAMFDAENEIIKDDLFDFIEEYCYKILMNRTSIKINIKRGKCVYVRKFSPQNISVILENAYSNSLKNNANHLLVDLFEDSDGYYIYIADNGSGLNKNAKNNIETLFEFGKSYSVGGTGVGLYHIKDIVENMMKGTVDIDSEKSDGFCLQIRFEK